MKSKTNMVINLIGLALVAVLTLMLFVPFFEYTLRDGSTAYSSIANYAWRPANAKDVVKLIAARYPNIKITNGTFAISTVALTMCALAVTGITLIMLKKKTPSVVFLLYGIIGTWAFLSMPPFWMGGFKSAVMFTLNLILVVGGVWYTVGLLDKTKRKPFCLPCNLISAGLMLVLILIVYPLNQTGTELSFSLRDVGKTAAANPYLVEPANANFGTQVLANPVFLLAAAALTMVVSLFCCRKEWTLFLQLVTGAVGMYIILTNPAFCGSMAAMGGGLICCMLLVVIAVIRLVFFLQTERKNMAFSCSFVAAGALLVTFVFLFLTCWTIGKPKNGATSFVSVMEVGISTVSHTAPEAAGYDDSVSKKAATLGKRVTGEIKNEMTLSGTYTEEEINAVSVLTSDFAWVAILSVLIAVGGIALNIVFRGKKLLGAADAVLGVGGVLMYTLVHAYHYSAIYLWLTGLYAIVVLLGVLIFAEGRGLHH